MAGLSDLPKTETTALLPQSSSSSIDWSLMSDADLGQFHGQSIETEEMEKTTHNDSLAKLQDMHNLYGSTRILHNLLVSDSQDRISDSIHRAVAQTEEEQDVQSNHHEGNGRHKRRSSLSLIYDQKKDSAVILLEKVKTTLFEDARSLAEGTIPQSVVLALVIGIACGIACWLYYSMLFFLLDFIWHELPKRYIEGHWQAHNYWWWIPIVSLIMVTLVGLTVVYMGEPGDLPYTISRVHHHAYIPMDHVLPMVFASMFSILAGGSLGPEAPLVAICGAIGGFISMQIFQQKRVAVVRKHTLMGMAGALAAFFGAPLGGSMFALEVCSRFGVEYFEHSIESIFCGEICLVVFRTLSGLAITPIWDLTGGTGRIWEIEPWLVLVGGCIGLLGALMAFIFATFHSTIMYIFASLQLLDNSRAVYRAWLGGLFVILIGVLVPHTFFWGEEEIQVVANMLPAKELPFIWPTTGMTGFEMDSAWTAFVVGMSKLVAISFTVAGGLRGGYIFPLMLTGCAFGRVLYCFLPEDSVPLQICVLCMAAGMNVAITRTAIATTLILGFLPGEPCAIPPILMASICSLFATAYVPFIKTQITRSDIDHSLFHTEHIVGDREEKMDDNGEWNNDR